MDRIEPYPRAVGRQASLPPAEVRCDPSPPKSATNQQLVDLVPDSVPEEIICVLVDRLAREFEIWLIELSIALIGGQPCL